MVSGRGYKYMSVPRLYGWKYFVVMGTALGYNADLIDQSECFISVR